MAIYQHISYNTNAKNNSNLRNTLSLAEVGNFEYSPGSFVQFSRSPKLYPERLQVLSEDFIEKYVDMSLSNNEEIYYIDIVFDKPTLVHGSVVVGYNLVSNHIDLSSIIEENINLTDIKNLGLVNKIKDTYPQIYLQYTEYLNDDWTDLPAGNILSKEKYAAGINKAIQSNRNRYKSKDIVNNFIDFAIQDKSLKMPKMENLGVFGDQEKNTLTYLNPIGIFNQIISDPLSGNYSDRVVGVIDTNPKIDDINNLSTLYIGNNLNLFKTAVFNTIISIPEAINMQKLRLVVKCPASFICNISAFYIDDQIYVPTIYTTDSGMMDLFYQVNKTSNPVTLVDDFRIRSSNNDTLYFSAKLIWEGQTYANVDDRIVYSLDTNNILNYIDLSNTYITGKNFDPSSINSFFIDGKQLRLEYLSDAQCDFGDDSNNIKIMYVHNIGIKSTAIANNTLPSIPLQIQVYNIDTIQSDLVKTIQFIMYESSIKNLNQSLEYANILKYDQLDPQDQINITELLQTYIYPSTNNLPITINSGKEGSISSSNILMSTQIVFFNEEIADISDIVIDIPKYTNENSKLIILPTNNFCQVGLNSDQYFDNDNFKILFSQQDSVNKFENNTYFMLVAFAEGIGSYMDTIFVHKIVIAFQS